MTEADVDPTVREWLFAREMLRRLGFSPDELFLAVHPTGKFLDEGGRRRDLGRPTLFLRVEAQGRQWTWTIGPTDLPVDKIRDHFEAASVLWNAGGFEPDGLLRSAVFAQKVELVSELQSKGFRLDVGAHTRATKKATAKKVKR